MPIAFGATPLEQAPSLASVLARKLREEIEGRRLRVGERFPTDAEISRAFGVSRTVVREAVSALREAGLISTQRGRGSVVVARSPSPPFSISTEELESIERVVAVYELRTALEVEGVALAAQRRTERDLEEIERRLSAVDAAIQAGDDVVEADIEFHLAIASATHNEYFRRVLETVRTVSMARRLMREDLTTEGLLQLYFTTVQQEHRTIATAIAKGDSTAARREMRKHLAGSRYRDLARRAGWNGGG